MQEVKHASVESQLGNTPCLCENTEEMFWLRESDDYDSRVKLGNLLSGQYRFKEAIDAYHSAEMIRDNDPMLYIRLGGAHLTLRNFDEAKRAYQKSVALGGSEKSVAYPMGVWHYLKKDYQTASENFSKVLPCGDEMGIAVLYWNSLCSMRGNLKDKLIESYHDDMQVGHHTAYKEAVDVILGKATVDEILEKTKQDKNDLNAIVTMYGIAVYLEHQGKNDASRDVINALLERKAMWPCISYLAAWGDMNA